MIESEISGQVPRITTSHSHCGENKSRAFRLRPVNTTERLGKKYSYLKSSILKFIAGIQLTVAVGLVLIQVAFLTISLCTEDNDSYSQTSLFIIGFGSIYAFAASIAYVALKESVYFWLHLAMATNIIALIASVASEVIISCLDSKPYVASDIIRDKIQGCSSEDIFALCKWCTRISGMSAFVLSAACARPVFLGYRRVSHKAPRHVRD